MRPWVSEVPREYRKWLGGVEPAWTVLEADFAEKLMGEPPLEGGALHLAVDLTAHELGQLGARAERAGAARCSRGRRRSEAHGAEEPHAQHRGSDARRDGLARLIDMFIEQYHQAQRSDSLPMAARS